MAAIRQAGRWVCGSALLAAVIVAMLVLLPSLFGWQRYAIVSGSMTGTYDRGTLVLDEVVPVADLNELLGVLCRRCLRGILPAADPDLVAR